MRVEIIKDGKTWHVVRGLHVVQDKINVYIFDSLSEMIAFQYFDDMEAHGFGMLREEWNVVLNWMNNDEILFGDSKQYTVDEVVDFIRSTEKKAIKKEYPLNVFISFVHLGRGHVIKHSVEESDYWWSEQGFDIHFCEDDGSICIYLEENYKLIHKVELNESSKN
jgi:hypothetical protein